MAEFVAEMQERTLPEYEQLKKLEVCTDDQIRDCMRKREKFHTKITQSGKTIRDYGDFIIFEKKIHKWVTEKEKTGGAALSGLKSSIATRIIRLYREGLRLFPHEERFWRNYIKFSKESVPHEVSGIYEKMLAFHGDIPSVWCDAALWTYENSTDVSRVKEIFFRGLQRHPDSELINGTFFHILLMEASKMSKEKSSPSDTTTEQEIGMQRVEVIYRNNKKKIANLDYYLSLLERCEEPIFLNMTAKLQKVMLDDLMKTYPHEESLWDALAQRELRGLNMIDLCNLIPKNASTKESAELNPLAGMLLSVEGNTDTETTADEPVDVKDPTIKGIFQKRTLRCRIELCCGVYGTAVRTLQTPEMWRLYINAMLKLNQDMTTQQVLKRKRLAIAFKEGHESGLMSIDHYCTFVRMLLETPSGVQIAEAVLIDVMKVHKSPKIYEVWLSIHIVGNNEPKVFEIFQKARADLGAASFPLWRLTIQFYKMRYDDCAKRLIRIYKDACQELAPEFGIFRGEYLEFCMLNRSIQKTRSEYDDMCKLQPPCLAMHQKMAMLESQIPAKTKADIERWRLCYEIATQYFGKTHSEVWIDYIKFERSHGDPKRMCLLSQSAISTLQSNLVDNFMSEYTMLTAVI